MRLSRPVKHFITFGAQGHPLAYTYVHCNTWGLQSSERTGNWVLSEVWAQRGVIPERAPEAKRVSVIVPLQVVSPRGVLSAASNQKPSDQ